MTEPQLVAIPSTLRWTGEPAVYTPERPHWQQHGACLASDPDTFFPERGEDSRPAKEICRGCPVRQECLDYALDTRQLYGIWGGTSERERRRMRPRAREARVNSADPQRDLARRMYQRGAAPAAIAVELGVTARTVHRYLDEAAS